MESLVKSYHNGRVFLCVGDCLENIDMLPDNSVDAIVTDPPYHLTSVVKRFGKESSAPAKDYTGVKEGATGAYARTSRGFMGKEWDGGDIAFRPETWKKFLRVLKPGGHMVAFSAPKCSHRMVCAIEDAGFEIRDGLMWIFATGFPKSLNVSKAIDKAAGAEREVIQTERVRDIRNGNGRALGEGINASGRDGPVYMDREITAPATDAAREWQGWGTALKPAYEPICLARKPLSEKTVAENVLRWGTGAINVDGCRVGDEQTETVRNGNSGGVKFGRDERVGRWLNPPGRFPANLCHDGSEDVLAGFPETASGSAARFFYSAKADKDDRAGSKHPTVKPVALKRWLARMITPPGGLILDPFAGTGTTAQAALLEGFNCILMEREAEYVADIEWRMMMARTEKES
jgi:DNA modification methylase